MPTNAFDVAVQGFQQQAADAQDMARLQLQVALNQWEQKKRAEEAVLADARDLDRQLKVAKENARLQAEAQRMAKQDTESLEFNRQLFELGRDKANQDFQMGRDKAKSREEEARATRERKVRSETAAANVMDLRSQANDMRKSAVDAFTTIGERARSPEAAMDAVRNLSQTGSITKDQATILSGLAAKGDLDAFQNQLDAYAKTATGWFGGETEKSGAIRNALATAATARAGELQQAAIVNMGLVDNSIRDLQRQAAEEGRYILPEHRALIEPAKPAGSPTGAQPAGAPKSEADRFKAVMGGAQPMAGDLPPEMVAHKQVFRMPSQAATGSEPSIGSSIARPLVVGTTVSPLAGSLVAINALPYIFSRDDVKGYMQSARDGISRFAKGLMGPTQKEYEAAQAIPAGAAAELAPAELPSALQQYIAAVGQGDAAKAQQLAIAIEGFRSKFSGGQHEPLTVQNAQQALAALQQQATAVQ